MTRTMRGSGSHIEFFATLVVLAASGASGAILLAVAEGGYATLYQLGLEALLPGIGVIVLIAILAWLLRWKWLIDGIASGFWIGLTSTVGLEIVRIIGFRVFNSMPGDLPTLMGMLLTNRIMQGPDTLSTFLGYADHFWNGVTFAIPFVLIFGKRPLWVAGSYGLLLGIGFLASPVPNAMGVGYFGVQAGPAFATTVLLAHLAFGVLIGWFSKCSACVGKSLFEHFGGHTSTIPSQSRSL